MGQNRWVAWAALASAVAAHLACAVATAAQVPDPLALLRGIEASRMAVQSGRLEISVLKERFAPAQVDKLVVAVVFEAEKRRCEESSRALVVDGRKDGSERKLQQMHDDREAFVRAGLGKWADVKVVSVWDGGDYKQAGTGLGAQFKDHLQGTGELVIDPRLLGLPQGYLMTATMSDCLALRHAKALSVVGKERIGSADVWHVLALLPSGAEFHYWIEDADGFRVYRTTVRTGKGPEETIESEFDDKVVEGLPVRTTLVKTGADGKVKSRVAMEVLNARLNVAVGPSEFSWGAMGLAVGDPVADERIGQTLGYWDGEKIDPEYDRAIERGGERRREAIGAARWSRISKTAVIVGVLVAFALFARRLVRARGNYGHR